MAELQATLESTADGILVTDLAGRLRAFESAYLLERATARARRQLAAVTPAT